MRFEDVAHGIEGQLRGQTPPVDLGHARSHLEANDRGEFPVAKLRLDHGQQIVGRLFISLRVGVPGDSKDLTIVDGHVRKEQIEVGAHDLFEGDEDVGVPNPHEPFHTGPEGDLDASKGRQVLTGETQRDEEVE